ncbi:MAG: hypothetical protein V1754_04790, partial [Pseudomonadota bacterium]
QELLVFTTPLLQPRNRPDGFEDSNDSVVLDWTRRLELRRLRLQGLASKASLEELEKEIATVNADLNEHGVEYSEAMQEMLITALLTMADRLMKSDDGASQKKNAQQLYQRVLGIVATGEKAGRARFALGSIALDAGDLRRAAAHFRFAASALSEPFRAQASYSLLHVLQRRIAEAPGTAYSAVRRELREQLFEVGWGFVENNSHNQETASVLMVLAAQAAQAKDYVQAARATEQFLRLFPDHARRDEVLDLALQVKIHQREWGEAYRLAGLSGCVHLRQEKSSDKGGCERFRKMASDAALQASKSFTSGGELAKALEWAERARINLDEGPERWKVAFLSAGLAARSKAYDKAFEIYAQIASVKDDEWRKKSLVAQGELHTAQGNFADAAIAYWAAAGKVECTEHWLELTTRATKAFYWAGKKDRANKLLRKLKWVIGQPTSAIAVLGSAKKYEKWVMKVGVVLELTGVQTHSYYSRQGNRLLKDHPRLAARCLVAAAENVLSLNRRRILYNQAMILAGPLRRNGKVFEASAKARLGLAEIFRTTWEKKKKKNLVAQITALQGFLDSATEVLLIKHPLWSAAAGYHVAWGLGEMASLVEGSFQDIAWGARAGAAREQVAQLRRRQNAVMEGLARLAKQPGGLNRYSLFAARERSGLDPVFRVDHLPENEPTVEPILQLIKTQKPEAAVEVATKALKIHGQREDLLCARAVARLGQMQPVLAVQDLQQALGLASQSRCARLNLGTLALWRGQPNEAKRLLEGVAGANVPAFAAVESEPGIQW